MKRQHKENHYNNASEQVLASKHESANLRQHLDTRETFGKFILYPFCGHRIDTCAASVTCGETIWPWGELSARRILFSAKAEHDRRVIVLAITDASDAVDDLV